MVARGGDFWLFFASLKACRRRALSDLLFGLYDYAHLSTYLRVSIVLYASITELLKTTAMYTARASSSSSCVAAQTRRSQQPNEGNSIIACNVPRS